MNETKKKCDEECKSTIKKIHNIFLKLIRVFYTQILINLKL